LITVKNLKLETPSHPYDVRVDRKSVLGSPFYLGVESNRQNVMDRYEKHIYKNCTQEMKDELSRLYNIYKKYGKLNLFCWCAPLPCHADIIKKIILKKEKSDV